MRDIRTQNKAVASPVARDRAVPLSGHTVAHQQLVPPHFAKGEVKTCTHQCLNPRAPLNKGPNVGPVAQGKALAGFNHKRRVHTISDLGAKHAVRRSANAKDIVEPVLKIVEPRLRTNHNQITAHSKFGLAPLEMCMYANRQGPRIGTVARISIADVVGRDDFCAQAQFQKLAKARWRLPGPFRPPHTRGRDGACTPTIPAIAEKVVGDQTAIAKARPLLRKRRVREAQQRHQRRQ
mmetsp:Transcript_29140/g.56165  ORF Transcript_29140/g.56165 Transcript_29140/m.56165 type:complete len:236 (+) Transcript_29140:4011-4718(+)